MPAALTISITRDDATPFMARLIDHLESQELRKVMARGLQQDVADHLITYDKRHPNRNAGAGWKRTHVFRDAARATHGKATSRGLRVSINHPMMRLRYLGGDIKPVKARLLAIPVDPHHPAADPQAAEAYGQSPRKFSHLRLIMYGNTGKGALVARGRTNIRKDRRKGRKGKHRGETIAGGGVYYWLVPKAHVDPDRTVLPRNIDLLRAAVKYADDYIETASPNQLAPGDSHV